MLIKFLSLNIWFGGKLLNQVINYLINENPDVLVLQEVYDSKNPSLQDRYRSHTILQQSLKYQFSKFASAFAEVIDNESVESGNAIYSKFPIHDSNVIFFDVPYSKRFINSMEKSQFAPRNMLHAVIRIANKNIDIFNIHGIWGVDGEDSDRRLAMSNIIVNHIKNKENVILAGDFNLKPTTHTIKNIEKYLTSVFGHELITTFNMKYKDNPGFATAAVDMIFVSRTFQVISKSCLNPNISDHLPLVTTISF